MREAGKGRGLAKKGREGGWELGKGGERGNEGRRKGRGRSEK